MAWIEPHWERVTAVSAALYPLSLLFGLAVLARRGAYRSGVLRAARLSAPVIVVGNITVGGAGKTPLVAWVAGFLRQHGFTPGIVSRGYGGTRAEPQRVMPDSDPHACGDEPVLLARRCACEVWTGADRAAAVRALLAAQPACNVVVSDDGLQHYALARNAELCVVDAARGLGNGWLLPAGPLREPASRLDACDAVVLNDDGAHAAPSLPPVSQGSAPRFAMRLEGHEFRNVLNPAHRVGVERFRGKRVHAVAGIGHPQRFFRHLQALGLDFTAHAFPDHHRYTSSELAFSGAEAVVMTEKDAVKCMRFNAETHWMLAVDAVPDPRLGDLILRKLEARP
jgi:tetraacyldisaccharide 4'-kinase